MHLHGLRTVLIHFAQFLEYTVGFLTVATHNWCLLFRENIFQVSRHLGIKYTNHEMVQDRLLRAIAKYPRPTNINFSEPLLAVLVRQLLWQICGTRSVVL